SGPEALRHEFDARVSDKDMAETYLPAFEALVTEAGVEAVMGAYNRVNGEPACGSKVLLQDILREEWRFEGHVVSDCWAIADFHTHHGVTATAVESAALALRRGCDLNCGHTYLHLIQALKDGLVTEEDIRLSAVRLMTTRYLLGLFDPHCEYNQITYDQNDTQAHHALALQAAQRSMVLLKNDGLLPLDLSAIKTIGVIGPNADSVQVLEGNYCGTSSRYVTFLRGIQDACEGKARVLYAQGCHLHKDSTSGLSLPDDRLSEALAVCAASDVVIVCVGLDASLEGEEGDTGNPFYSGDKNDLELPGVQRRLIKAVLSSGKSVVTLLGAGSSVCAEEGNAVLLTWYPGQAGGTAAADILFGKCSPSGKLPVTFYRGVEDLPGFEDYSMKNRTYRYFKGEPLYPFGYGLTYTNVTVNNARADTDGCETRVWVSLDNKGAMDTEEVIQVYIKDETSPFAPPNPVLCAFKRVFLKAGEAGEFMLTVDPKAFTVVDDDGKRRVTRGGLYSLYAGLTQPDPRSELLTGTAPVKMQVTLSKNVSDAT
ncbi:MAG: glycoside hydrolase family 3 C-terminal domain-containing protein, partial [Clostridia bacterium]|nr:glycoside hydrolase family 3 C-terminal domain-containing protein [Clostridia bacterium]